MQARKTLLSWSSGKDSAWALRVLRQEPGVAVAGLFTTVNERFGRVAMHAVRVDLLRRQAAAAGLPLYEIPIPHPCPNAEYEARMQAFVKRALEGGVQAMAFGDLFLADIRKYREEKLEGTGIQPLFPVWGLPTDRLSREMVAAGLKARIVSVDPKQLSSDFVGREYDARFLEGLPASADPCGERGEFHTFAYDGPMFRRPVPVKLGEIVEREGFFFADLLPADGNSRS